MNEKCYVVYTYVENGNVMEDDHTTVENFKKAKETLRTDYERQYDVESAESPFFDKKHSFIDDGGEYAKLVWDNGCMGFFRILREGVNY